MFNTPEISLEGFQIVKGEMFAHATRTMDPTCTLWPTSICCNKVSLTVLNNCTNIRIEINSETRCMLIIPVTEKDRDAVRWAKNVKDPVARKIDCPRFTSQLYETWGWDKEYVYRANGRIVTADNKVMLLFDFSAPESWMTPEAKKKLS